MIAKLGDGSRRIPADPAGGSHSSIASAKVVEYCCGFNVSPIPTPAAATRIQIGYSTDLSPLNPHSLGLSSSALASYIRAILIPS